MKKTSDDINIIYTGRYNDNENPSGAIFTARNIFKQYCRNHSGIFIEYFFDGNKYNIFKKFFGKEVIIQDKKTIIIAGLFRILPLLIKQKPNIIHIITFERFAVIFLLYKIYSKVKIIYSSHGVIKYENKIKNDLSYLYKLKDSICEYLFLALSDKLIFPSEQALDKAEEFYRIKENKVIILPNGVNDIFYQKNKKYTSEKLNAVIHYKNVYNRSGAEFLKKAIHIFPEKMLIYIITDLAIDFSEYVNVIKINLMKQNELAEFYKDKNIILNLNNYDTFSIATAEAMASGLIPIVTKSAGISRYIINGVNGWAVDYSDIASLSEILNNISKMKIEQLEELSIKAQQTVTDLKTENVYIMYEELYKEILR